VCFFLTGVCVVLLDRLGGGGGGGWRPRLASDVVGQSLVPSPLSEGPRGLRHVRDLWIVDGIDPVRLL